MTKTKSLKDTHPEAAEKLSRFQDFLRKQAKLPVSDVPPPKRRGRPPKR